MDTRLVLPVFITLITTVIIIIIIIVIVVIVIVIIVIVYGSHSSGYLELLFSISKNIITYFVYIRNNCFGYPKQLFLICEKIGRNSEISAFTSNVRNYYFGYRIRNTGVVHRVIKLFQITVFVKFVLTLCSLFV